jgi:magnesium transporter
MRTLCEAIDTYRETCSNLRDYHLAAVGNRTNDAMRKLTFLATIFFPLSFIAGLYGMNFDYMPTLQLQYGYGGAIALMGSVAAGLLLWFFRKGWFG